MQSKVSERGQTVIPREIRRAFQISAKTRLEWIIRDGIIIVYPLPTDPVRGSFGILKGVKGASTNALLAERRADRKREHELELR
jgi:AbrB family looped-hinge helix DNA binding protein